MTFVITGNFWGDRWIDKHSLQVMWFQNNQACVQSSAVVKHMLNSAFIVLPPRNNTQREDKWAWKEKVFVGNLPVESLNMVLKDVGSITAVMTHLKPNVTFVSKFSRIPNSQKTI